MAAAVVIVAREALIFSVADSDVIIVFLLGLDLEILVELALESSGQADHDDSASELTETLHGKDSSPNLMLDRCAVKKDKSTYIMAPLHFVVANSDVMMEERG